jgi:hypothetical protein
LVDLAEHVGVFREAVQDGGSQWPAILVISIDCPFILEGGPESSAPPHLFEALLASDDKIEYIDKPECQWPEASNGQTCQYPPNPQMIMRIPHQGISKPVLALDPQTSLIYIDLNTNKIHILLKGPNHPLTNVPALPKNLGLLIVQGMAGVVKPGPVVVGEHPLDVVVGVLHPLEVLAQLRVQVLQEEIAVGDGGLVAVEQDVRQRA